MVANEITKYANEYKIKVREEPNSTPDSKFIGIIDAEKDLPPIVIHFIKDKIYSVSFLNNEFFEIPEVDLWSVVSSLLQGSYKVEVSLFRKTKSIKVTPDDKEILPERTHGSSMYKEAYNKLPAQFSRIQQGPSEAS